jgi:hypothetical protein
MPLRDHFRPPTNRTIPWDGIFGGWPALLTKHLNQTLPAKLAAEPRVRHLPINAEDHTREFAVQVFDHTADRRMVAAIEFITPAYKEQPDHRRAFVAKCAHLLQTGVALVLVDVVTVRPANLLHDLLTFLAQVPPAQEPPALYAAALRPTVIRAADQIQIWDTPPGRRATIASVALVDRRRTRVAVTAQRKLR